MIKTFIFLLLVFFSFNATASSYHVEIIIFEHLSRNSDGEISQIGLKIPNLGNSIILDDFTADENSTFKLLPTGMYKLGGVYNELKFSKYYRPLFHMAWQQPALNQSRARNVRIRKVESNEQNILDDLMIKIDGIIRIRSAQFLHADVDLFYFINALSESYIQANTDVNLSNTIQIEFAELKETRKMKLNELHYFDHPVFGLFLWVSRFSN
jgi:hypothetical protein